MKTWQQFLESINQFGYRAISNYELTKRNGIIPDWNLENGEKVIYFSDHEDGAKRFGNLIIRFPFPQDAEKDPGHGSNPYGNGEYYISRISIPPINIEIKTDTGNHDFYPLLRTKLDKNWIIPKGK